jgi:ribosome biogenesis protein ENP2
VTPLSHHLRTSQQDHEVQDFQFLSDDYSKLAILRADRTVLFFSALPSFCFRSVPSSADFLSCFDSANHLQLEFHAGFGRHHKTRIPRFGRDLTYDPATADLYVTADTPTVYRLNLHSGRFVSELETGGNVGVNVSGRHPIHGLLAFGGEDGAVECWDTRVKKRYVGV